MKAVERTPTRPRSHRETQPGNHRTGETFEGNRRPDPSPPFVRFSIKVDPPAPRVPSRGTNPNIHPAPTRPAPRLAQHAGAVQSPIRHAPRPHPGEPAGLIPNLKNPPRSPPASPRRNRNPPTPQKTTLLNFQKNLLNCGWAGAGAGGPPKNLKKSENAKTKPKPRKATLAENFSGSTPLEGR